MTTERAVTDELQQMVDDAQKADAPGDTQAGSIVNNPATANDPDDLPMTVAQLQRAGYVKVYDIRDGRVMPIDRNLLRTQLRKTDPKTGKRIFTTRDPGYRPEQGKYVCWLNPESPQRHFAEDFGFRQCSKSNIPSPFDAERHMRAKHPTAYRAIKEAEERKREDEDRALQRQLLEKALAVPAQPSGAAPEASGEAEQEAKGYSATCEVCGEALTATNAGLLGAAKKAHAKTHE